MQLDNPEAQVRPATLGALVVGEMLTMYGSKFRQQWQGLKPSELREAWDRYMGGMTETEIRTGLIACLSRDWPPSVPEFVRLCRPWMDPEVAFYLAVKGMAERRAGQAGAWPHPALYWAAVHVGAHDLANSGYSVLRGRWETALTAQLSRGAWDAIPEPASALPAPGQTVATREEAEAHLRKVGAASVVNNRRRDLREWPKRILAKPGNYSPAVLAMARRALGIESEAS